MKTKIFFLSVLSSLLLGCETVQHSNYSQPKIWTKVIPAYLSKSGEPEFVIPLPPNTDEHYELFFVHKGQY